MLNRPQNGLKLDLNEAVHRVSFKSNGVNYLRECFASYPDKVIVLRLTASKKGMISGKIRLADAHQAAISVSGNKITAKGKITENQMEYESQIQVLNKGGKATKAAMEDIALKTNLQNLKIPGVESASVMPSGVN
ncbi:MAG: hypothetical protein GZ094_00035 [Mariniphaga sp.]|nr:hypothetical protein [Mariniphaga sp.]